MLSEGMEAPNFTLPDERGKKVSLSDFRGKKVVLYFYPKDDTPGCTKEACGFRDAIEEIKNRGAVVLGVSLDGQEAHRRFITKYDLPFTLLCDEDATVSRLYDVYKLRSLYGREFWGIERSTFMIDEGGMVKRVFRKVQVDNHVQEALDALSS